ncbi:PREDICTED: alpha-ketoglutarate-dependent dioxygenase alkB homolog 6 [Dufourea novaeangliae]|uniref:alpha-ketoglutarate-dependent dioxygenase alkB homolog 6 n=1 Tax=Dufourea novaeangliae TaxID=178035 RepID=UPI000767BD2D|nr:PREDICTED: alpha-ketoglutarate-dependent dioxygenase alkB homolog 6 [Dufourea novaeangliae]
MEKYNGNVVSKVPNLAIYIPNFITEKEELEIVKHVNKAPLPKWTQLSHRRLQNWGGIPHIKGMIAEDIPTVQQLNLEFSFLLERRSLLILQENLYHHYLHSIAERDTDVISKSLITNLDLCGDQFIEGQTLKRDIRLSLTIRHVPKTTKLKLKIN